MCTVYAHLEICYAELVSNFRCSLYSKFLTCFEFSDWQYYKTCIYRQLVISVKRTRKKKYSVYCVGECCRKRELLSTCLRSQAPYCNLTFNSPWDISYTASLLSVSCNPLTQHQTPSAFHSFFGSKCENRCYCKSVLVPGIQWDVRENASCSSLNT